MLVSNKQLREAHAALVRLGEAAIPAFPAFKLALALNQLEALAGPIEKARISSVKAHRLNESVLREENDPIAASKRLEEFTEEWNALLDGEEEFESHVKVAAKTFSGVKDLRANDLAAIVKLGIITNPEALEE